MTAPMNTAPSGRTPAPDAPTVGDSVRRLTDALSRLLRDHLALFRAELQRDLKVVGRDVVLAAAGIPGLLLGYAMLMVALALLLAPWLTLAGGFAAVGALNLLAGGGLVAVFGRRLASTDRLVLDRTTDTIREDGRWLRELRS